MYIVAIAWLYVLLLISIMQPTVFRGIVTFVAAGLFPLGLLLYLMGTPRRRRDLAAREHAPDAQPAQQTVEAGEAAQEMPGAPSSSPSDVSSSASSGALSAALSRPPTGDVSRTPGTSGTAPSAP